MKFFVDRISNRIPGTALYLILSTTAKISKERKTQSDVANKIMYKKALSIWKWNSFKFYKDLRVATTRSHIRWRRRDLHKTCVMEFVDNFAEITYVLGQNWTRRFLFVIVTTTWQTAFEVQFYNNSDGTRCLAGFFLDIRDFTVTFSLHFVQMLILPPTNFLTFFRSERAYLVSGKPMNQNQTNVNNEECLHRCFLCWSKVLLGSRNLKNLPNFETSIWVRNNMLKKHLN